VGILPARKIDLLNLARRKVSNYLRAIDRRNCGENLGNNYHKAKIPII
jgi:hypothetical protein